MTSSTSDSKQSLGNVVVVGGCGFLGRHIVRKLAESYVCTVYVLDLKTTNNRVAQVSYHEADITSATDVRSAFESIKPHIIIHTASPAAVTAGTNSKQEANAKSLYYKVNVEGTKNLIEQAAQVGTVKGFIYTSSASVIHDSRTDLINANESFPILYSPVQKEYYSETKAIAEQAVIDANRQHGQMLTCALRPAGIFGEGDVQVAANMLKAYEKGQTKFQVGSNDNLFDFTYVGNVADAHILAAIALLQTHQLGTEPLDHEKVDGEAFLITNGQPVYFWDFARGLWSAAGDKTRKEQVWEIGQDTGLTLATLFECMFWLAGRVPNLTRQKVLYSTTTRYYSMEKARERLGYNPKVSMDEAILRTVKWFEEQKEQPEKKSQ